MQRSTQKALVRLTMMAVTFAFFFQPVVSHAQAIRRTVFFVPFGMVGLARAQTARLNVVNLDPPDPDLDPPDPDLDPPDPDCEATLSFADSDGMPFLTPSGAPLTQEFRLMTGKAAFLDLTPRDAFPRDSRDLRTQFRGKVALDPPDPDMPDPCVGLVATLEIFDNFTGRTMVLYALPAGLDPPDPDTPAPGQ